MSCFITQLRVSHKDGKWELVDALVYQSEIIGRVVVPVGFSTDFASVPRIPLAYMLFGDVVHEPAVIHDYLYATHKVSRSIADRVMVEAMTASNINVCRRWLMWVGVRLFGWVRY